MDYYSNFPPPSREEAIKEVVKKVVVDHPDFDSDELLKICTNVVTEMPNLGSYTGWYVSFQKDAIEMVKKNIDYKSDAINVETLNK